jgi:hypothetical protein
VTRRAVVFACDAGYLPFALFAARQIAALHPDRGFDLVLCSTAPLAIPDAFAGLGLRRVTLDVETAFAGMPLDARRTVATYLRLALPDALAADYDRLLYLDADVFAQHGGIDALLGLDLGGAAVAAVRDNSQWRTPGRRAAIFRRLGLPALPYLNAGVLLIDAARWRADGLGPRLLAFGAAHAAALVHKDQDVLNGVLQGRFVELSPVWNWQHTSATRLFEPMAEARIIHFIGPGKPWSPLPGQPPDRFAPAYRAFLAAHFPDRTVPPPQPPPDARTLRKTLIRHALAAGPMARYLARFPQATTTHG